MSFERKCKNCERVYEYKLGANYIVFCPYCQKADCLECEYGYGPVVPCYVYLGKEEIAMVSYHDRSQRQYRYDSSRFNVHQMLEHTYLEALHEACNITSELLQLSK